MFVLSPTLPRSYRDVHSEPAPFAGYESWLDELTFAPEPPPDAPTAVYVDPETFAALIAEDEPTPPEPRPLTPREERGTALALAGGVFAHGPFFVAAGSKGDRYMLRREGAQLVCECADFTFRIAPALEAGRTPAAPMCYHAEAIRFAEAHNLVVNARGAAA